MFRTTLPLTCAALCCLAACAKSPESIAPAYTSEIPYDSWTCKQLSDETIRINEALAAASVQQQNARTNDTVGVILIGLPVSSLSGDNIAPEIAQYKGQIDAIHRAMLHNNCGTAPAS